MPVVAPVNRITSFAAIARARRSAFVTSVLPVSSRALSDAAEPITPTLIRIVIPLIDERDVHRVLAYVLPDAGRGPTNAASRTPASRKMLRCRSSQAVAETESDRAARR